MGIDKEGYCNLEELYIEFEKLVYVFIKDYTCEEHEIKDISQIVWLKVWRNLDKFQNMGKSDVNNYLRAISRNSVADYFKEKRKENDILDEIGYLSNYIDNKSVEDEIEEFLDRELCDYLDEAMDLLNESERELIGLKYGDRLSSKEIGELLGLSDSSVRGRLKRILEKLEKEILRIKGRENKHGL